MGYNCSWWLGLFEYQGIGFSNNQKHKTNWIYENNQPKSKKEIFWEVRKSEEISYKGGRCGT